jgi:hypothetical protein
MQQIREPAVQVQLQQPLLLGALLQVAAAVLRLGVV